MDPIKEAFLKIKEDISNLRDEIIQIRQEIKDIRFSPPGINQTHIQTNQAQNTPNIPQQTNNQTHIQTNQAQNIPIQASYTSNIDSSIGNKGVPTDKQTHTQTDQQTTNFPISELKQVNNILNSLDSIKKEIRLKFKRLTPQEMLVFSVIYALEDQNYPEITYRIVAKETALSESSIRDYINKLINKGIPITKIRQNNKTIILKISEDLKKIATLATIQNLREL